jgi:hypothetical protein
MVRPYSRTTPSAAVTYGSICAGITITTRSKSPKQAPEILEQRSQRTATSLSGLFFNFNKTASEIPLKDGSSPLTISRSEINGDPGENGNFTATTTTAAPGAFSWQMAKEEETDDLTAYTLVASSCSGQNTCTAKLVNHHPGMVNVQVAFHPAT